MVLKEILSRLMDDNDISPQLDEGLAKFMGWSLSPNGEWLSPTGDQVAAVPCFTENLDDAIKLVEGALPLGTRFAFSWESNLASAKIGDDKFYQSRKPARALCIAGVIAKARQG